MPRNFQQTVVIAALFLGCALVVYGGILFGYQVFLWARYDTWASLPASYLFLEPPFPPDKVELIIRLHAEGWEFVGKDLEAIRVDHTVLESLVLLRLLEYVPGLFRSNDSWLARPSSWFGAHSSLRALLNSLSISSVSILLGIGIIIASALGLEEDVPKKQSAL